MTLTQKRLKELLHYDPLDGVFTWLTSSARRIKVGDVAGSISNKGYSTIYVDYKPYLSHRLAFLYMEGRLPENQADHINGIKNDNRWCNLRHATQKENNRNVGVNNANTSGYKGVGWHKPSKRWRARIKVNKKEINLGFFKNKRHAAKAYNNAAIKYHGEFCYTNII